ncbi:hypothetical protein [Secundilactobacillus odoratitofui]|uniref:hypothetical protein n=1 Tax=Secundilactobacillus odoratitofui TaxID=480930 RepID=UPI0006D0DA61|nr:hypothetical protein [Secundilactobacillus odoratitofui]
MGSVQAKGRSWTSNSSPAKGRAGLQFAPDWWQMPPVISRQVPDFWQLPTTGAVGVTGED